MKHVANAPDADRSLFHAMVTTENKTTPSFCGPHGPKKITLVVWYSQEFGPGIEMQEQCKPLLEAISNLTLVEGAQPAMIFTPLLKQIVTVHSLKELREAKIRLARQTEQHLGMVTTIQ